MTKLLLVHGGWMDERCWDKLLPHLFDQGIQADTITLPGNGVSSTSAFGASMQKSAVAIHEKMAQMGGDVTLLGHSMGGYSISAVAQMSPQLVERMIYLSAWVPPKTGQSMAQIDRTHGDVITGPLVKPAVKWKLLRGVITLDPVRGADFLCQMADENARDFLFSTTNPQPIRPGLSKVPWTEDRLGRIPKIYIECEKDAAIPLEGQQYFQSNANFAKVVRIESDHSPFVSMPEVLASTIAGLL